MTSASSSRAHTRTKIVVVAARLLEREGPEAVTTRRVAEEAGVQAPAIYRLFGDKDGLLEAVTEQVMARYVSAKADIVEAASAADVDPLEDLRAGWEMQLDFAVANPAVFRLMSDPVRALHSPAARSGRRVLESRVHRVAATGRLRVREQRAVDLIQAAGIGVTQTWLSAAPEQRDLGLADSMYEAVLSQILTGAQQPAADDAMATVVAFRAIAPQLDRLTRGEQDLLGEWLDRALDGLDAARGGAGAVSSAADPSGT